MTTMKQPSPAQRHRIYFKVLGVLKADKACKVFMCNAICDAYAYIMYSKARVDFHTNAITGLFPEFIAQKPKELYYDDKPFGDGDIWWDYGKLGHEKVHQMQIDVIKECVKQLKNIDTKIK